MRNLIIFGPPGSGKGTQSIHIANKYNLAHISTGDIFRSEIKNETELGLKVKGLIEKGELVPDELLIDILKSAMNKFKNVDGFIFDGFPRTIPQARDLDEVMDEMNDYINIVLALDVNDDEVIARLLKRAELEGRKDDNEEVIINRLNIYKEQTEPLLEYYANRDKLKMIHGIGSIEDIFKSLCEAIDKAE